MGKHFNQGISSNSFNSESGKGAQNNELFEGQVGAKGSDDQKAGGKTQGLIHISGAGGIKPGSRLEPASIESETSLVVNFSQQPKSVKPEKAQELSEFKTP